jgi:hypothetical protein
VPPADPAGGPQVLPGERERRADAVIAFGFSVMALSLTNAEIINIQAGIFVPIAFGTGALGMLVGGLWESRQGT